MTPSTRPMRFSLPARVLHWLMAPAIFVMLLLGSGLVTTVSIWRPLLLDTHKTLGMLLLLLVLLRLAIRLTRGAPALPSNMPGWQRGLAHLSHWLLYGLMLAMPLIGWAMLSAAGYPLPGIGGWHVPALMAPDVVRYALLRHAHGVLGRVFFWVILVHLCAGLAHALLLRDGVFNSMALRLRR
ncbi:cytochrome b [Amantichitinum ursilacus]|uniref:Cytochrome b561 bacterial/Ni-hydrogenase domain-containing protein n=1 Tax=Amantichitinum ursilacus TaxID=857265 RepID=A0A0N0GL39_9NEIS|nr:cytochrome b/b6 domain-containing protein [Amantichitinum ursilacus]KPC49586.1 hypothetical protein WG78_19720 [Amantichitinum ursilacus]